MRETNCCSGSAASAPSVRMPQSANVSARSSGQFSTDSGNSESALDSAPRGTYRADGVHIPLARARLAQKLPEAAILAEIPRAVTRARTVFTNAEGGP